MFLKKIRIRQKKVNAKQHFQLAFHTEGIFDNDSIGIYYEQL